MSEPVRIPGTRELEGSLDSPDADARTDDTAVVACPPHPQMGGSRTDARLRAVGERLAEHGVACLRFDYGPWDEGDAEQDDALNALGWARDRYDRVGLFGYSFGAGVTLLAAADADPQPDAVAVLAPPATLGGFETVPALESLSAPVGVCYGERDSTVDWEPVVERARERGHDVTAMSADHFFVGQVETVADCISGFLVDQL
jgi:alpha/beta superfamily hydrolase